MRNTGKVQHHWKGVSQYATVGLELGLSVVVGLYAGWWLDRKLASTPWLTLVGLGFGAAAGFRAVYRALQRANREAEQLDRQEREARDKYHGRRDAD
jgi:ATP synthase protein I